MVKTKTDPVQKLTSRDILFAAINGLIFGALLPFTLNNLAVSMTIEKGLIIAIIFAILAAAGVTIGYFLSRILSFFFQLAKFGSVGAANFAIDIGIYNLLIVISGISAGFAVDMFAGVSFVVAVTNSYFWNKWWTFKKTDTKKTGKEFAQFLTVSVIGFLLNIAILHLIVNTIGPLGAIKPTAWANVGKATASICVLAWNFLGYKFWVFKK